MKRVALITLTVLWATFMAQDGAAHERPNVILIMADDMGYECLGCNGSASYETPNLDRLAGEGIRFVHCYSQPLCTPSRVKLMTGKYNFRNYEEFGYLNPEERTFGHLMRSAGYATCIAGKWQLNGLHNRLAGYQDSSRPFDAGFDESCLWQLTRPRSAGERYANPLIEINGKVQSTTSSDYGPRIFANFVCDFVERNKDRPFFVYYPMVLTHDPFVPTPDSPEWESGDRHAADETYFADMVTYADKIVGQIDRKLKQLGIRDQTILLFTGDNGTGRGVTSRMTDGRRVQGGKGTTPDAGTHVPLIASWPGHAQRGVINRDLIDFTDFYATLADLVGTTGPDGHSFLPQLRGETGHPRTFVFCHYDSRWGRTAKLRTRFARDATYKLYLDGRLYHVPEDVLERHAIEPGDINADTAREKLRNVLASMPAWEPMPPDRVDE